MYQMLFIQHSDPWNKPDTCRIQDSTREIFWNILEPLLGVEPYLFSASESKYELLIILVFPNTRC